MCEGDGPSPGGKLVPAPWPSLSASGGFCLTFGLLPFCHLLHHQGPGVLGPPHLVGGPDGGLRAGFSMKNFTLVTRIFLELALEVVVGLIDIQVCLFFSASCFILRNVRSSSLVMGKAN